MGYEIAGGLGVKMADPSREVYVMVGDGSYLMMSSEIVTSIQEGYKLNIVLLDNHGFSSIGGLSQADRLAADSAPTTGCRTAKPGSSTATIVPVDFAAAARRAGRAAPSRGDTRDEFEERAGSNAKTRPHHRRRDRGGQGDARARLRILVGRADRRSVRDREHSRRAREYEQEVKKERHHEIAAGVK